MNWNEIKAKSDGTTLYIHTKEVCLALCRLINSLPLTAEDKEKWKGRLTICAVMHDIGKIHPDFQNNLAGTSRYPVAIRHELVSVWMCQRTLNLSLEELFAIATHHKGVCRKQGENGCLDISMLTGSLSELLQEHEILFNQAPQLMREWLGLFQLPLEVNADADCHTYELSKELIAALRNHKQADTVLDALQCAKYRAFLLSADHLASAGRTAQIEGFAAPPSSAFQPKINGVSCELRAFQKRLLNHRGDVILYAPTGSGKTEAVLCWIYANHLENARIFYMLPFTASIHAMVKRLAEVFGAEKVTPVHSRTLDFFYGALSEDEITDAKNREEVARTLKQLSREVFHPVKVATPHQILKNALQSKGWELSLLEYEKGLFVFDEFHTYNPLLTGLIFAMARWLKQHFNAQLFFMSATIPQFMLERLIELVFDGDRSLLLCPDPFEESDREILGRERHRLICHSDQSICDAKVLIDEQLRIGKSVLLIVNHVKSAQTLYNLFSKEIEDTCLLHGGFNAKDRNRIEERITNSDKSRRPRLLIATQAVEVSLDIDYDTAFIENAPIDALIQRLGRVNRVGAKGIVDVHLFQTILGNVEYIYDSELLTKTWKVLFLLNNEVLTEEVLTTSCNEVYSNGYTKTQEADFNKGFSNLKIEQFFKKMIVGDWQDGIEEVLELHRLKIDVVCSNLKKEFFELLEKKLYIEARQLLVAVYPWETCSKQTEKGFRIAYDLSYTDGYGVEFVLPHEKNRVNVADNE